MRLKLRARPGQERSIRATQASVPSSMQLASVGTSYFVLTLPLRVSAADERALHLRMEAGRQMYNTVLGDALRVLARMRASPDWQRARDMPPGNDRAKCFRAVYDSFDLTRMMSEVAKLVMPTGVTKDQIGVMDAGCFKTTADIALKFHVINAPADATKSYTNDFVTKH